MKFNINTFDTSYKLIFIMMYSDVLSFFLYVHNYQHYSFTTTNYHLPFSYQNKKFYASWNWSSWKLNYDNVILKNRCSAFLHQNNKKIRFVITLPSCPALACSVDIVLTTSMISQRDNVFIWIKNNKGIPKLPANTSESF